MVRLGERYNNVGLDVCFALGDGALAAGQAPLNVIGMKASQARKVQSGMDMSNPHVGLECGHKHSSRGRRGTLPYASQHPADAWMASFWRALVRGKLVENGYLGCCRCHGAVFNLML
jgi:hypothetical protein